MLSEVLVTNLTTSLSEYLIPSDDEVYIPLPIADLIDPADGNAGTFATGTNEYTFVFEFIESNFNDTTGSPVLFSYGDTGKLNGWFVQKQTISQPRLVHYCESGNTGQFNYRAYSSSYVAGRHVMAVTLRADGTFVIFHNGYKAAWKENITKPTSYNDGLALNRYGNSSASLAGTSSVFKRVRVYDKGFSDAQGIKITRPTSPVLDDATYPKQEGVKGILFTGQSNESGRGNIAETQVYTNAARMKNLGLNFTYGNYSDPANSDSGSLQAVLNDSGAANSAMGHTLDGILTARPDLAYLVAIPAALPATSFAEHWGADISIGVVTNNDANLKHVGTMLNAALQRAVAANFIVEVAAINNHMGERDSANAVATPNATVTEKAAGFADVFRLALNKPNLPVQFNGLHIWHSDLAAAQNQALWEGKYAAYQAVQAIRPHIGVVTLSDIVGTGGDRVHIPNAGLLTKAQRGSGFFASRI